ncbi:hypothetical protein AK830_g4632 [Neonectria ditissima]|uniref:Protein NO VEIN C-terminal domain-containing protein n=1 Tax=Neonectria ditissima TaxID=78410 RepID=A0A0N8H7J4_9HYPO|nr:hypothetical protein AK830_g4632 [Neonectria ditissima]
MHVVDELCSLHKENPDGIVQRCEELLTILKHYVAGEPDFPQPQMFRLKTTRMFPVLLKVRDISQAGAGPKVALRALSDESWYIPDRLTLEAAFQGKVNMLAFSLRSVNLLEPLFTKLGLEKKYLSLAVKETVEPRGTVIRDIARNNDLDIRAKHFAHINSTSVSPSPQTVMPLRVWSVPSLVVVRRIGLVVVEEDNELITFQEDSALTNIYLRLEIPLWKEAEVNYRLAEFFSKQYNVKSEDLNFFNFLLGAPVGNLGSMLAGRNRSQPEERRTNDPRSSNRRDLDQATNMVDLSETAKAVSLGAPTPVIDLDEMDVIVIEDDDARVQRHDEAQSVTREEATHLQQPTRISPLNPVTVSPGAQVQYSLRELIPSFRLRAQSVARSAQNFRISKYPITRGSVQARVRNERFAQQAAVPRAPVPVPPPPAAGGWSAFFSEAGSSLESPIEIPDLTATSTVQQVRNREIGFLGEAFVLQPLNSTVTYSLTPPQIHKVFEHHISDWSYENWTSKLRVEDGHAPFTQFEGEFADFTYVDRSGQMKAFFLGAGVSLDAGWCNGTKYHLEVKTTTSSSNEPFFVSQNQVDMMQKFENDPGNAYILLRVFNIERDDPGLKFHPKPWSLYLSGILAFVSAGGYQRKGEH